MTSTSATQLRLCAVDVMSAPAITVCPEVSAWQAWPVMSQCWVLPDADLREVAQKMMRDGVDVVPVVDRHGRPLGVVTAAALLAAVARSGIVEDAIDVCDS